MAEVVWMDMNIQMPPERSSRAPDGEYNVTVYCKFWVANNPRVMWMVWKKDEKTKRFDWYSLGSKIPSTWEVTHWAYKPEPAWKEE